MIVLIVIFWYLGYQNRQTNDQELARYREAIATRQNNLETIVKNSANDRLNLPTLRADWSKIELTLLPDATPENIKAYGHGLALALAPFAIRRESEIKLALAALDGNDPTPLKDLVAARLDYEQTATALRQLPVPTAVADWHRQLVNNLENSALLIGQMEKILLEPVTGLEAGRIFLQETVLFYQTIDKINRYFQNQKIDFAADEKLELFVNLNQ